MSQPIHRDKLSARYFPNVSTGGHYSPHTLSINLDVAPPTDGIKGAPEREAWFRQHLPLIAHEYQHGLDHVGTIVGRKLLDGLRRAYHALDCKLDYDESELHRWTAFHDLQKRFYRRAYFTENDPTYVTPTGARPSWGWDTSIGRGFDLHGHPDASDPIMFVRFHDVDRGKKIARQPLTAASLFEARAMATELEHLVSRKIAEFGQNKTKWDSFNAEQQGMFYDVDLTIYSAPAHFLASRLNMSDPVPVYRLTAMLAWIALNVTDTLTLAINSPPGWDGVTGDAEALKERLVQVRDPGFLFFCLAAWAPPYDNDDEAWIDACLERAGFPSRKVIEDAAYEVLKIPDADSTTGTFDTIYWSAATSGAVNFRRLAPRFGLFGQKTLLALKSQDGPVALPNTIVGPVILSPSAIQPFMTIKDQELVGVMEQHLADHMGEFLAACR
jgi:hypothetical protein